ELGQDGYHDPDPQACYRSVQELARHAGVGRSADQAQPLHRPDFHPVPDRGRKARPFAHWRSRRLYQREGERDRAVERQTRSPRTMERQYAADDEYWHFPRLCLQLPEEPSRRAPGHDDDGATDAAYARGAADRDLLLHEYNRLGRV